MKNKIHIILATILLMMSVSCSDFLTRLPSNSTTAEQSIGNVDEAKVALNGLIRQMTSSYYYGRNFLLYADIKGGDFFVASLGRGLDALYTFTHAHNTNSYSSYWNQIYFCILQTNNILENIESGNILVANSTEQATLDDIKGQALTLRALCHFDLVRIYGYPYLKDNGAGYGVPIVTRSLGAQEKLPRNTVSEVYAQVMTDLNAATPLLKKGKSNGYLNYYSAVGLLARVNLFMGKYAEALSLSEEIINSGAFTEYTAENWANSFKTTFGSESIIEFAVEPGEGDLTSSSPRYYLLASGVEGAIGAFVMGESWLERLGEDPTDVRWSIMKEDEYALMDPANPKYIEGRLGSLMKYDGDGKATTTAVNIKVMRYSEILLIAAEAALETNAKDKAVTYLNKIRSRSPGLAPATVSTINLEMIMNERSKELAGEGHRFFDLLRRNLTVSFDPSMDYILAGPPTTRAESFDWSYNKVVLPISLDEINANPALADQQNPGY